MRPRSGRKQCIYRERKLINGFRDEVGATRRRIEKLEFERLPSRQALGQRLQAIPGETGQKLQKTQQASPAAIAVCSNENENLARP
jgi:hypothetical protein